MQDIELEVLKQVKNESKSNLLKKDEEVKICKKNIIVLKNELQSLKDSRDERLSLKKLSKTLAISECALFAVVIAGTVFICKDVSIILGYLNLSFMGLASHIGIVSLYDKISNKRIVKDNKENHTDEMIEYKNKKLNHERKKYNNLKEEKEKLVIIYQEENNKYLKEKNNLYNESNNYQEENVVKNKSKTKIKKLN